ncbi:MAG: hypothetical protein LBT54_04095 [Bifidobacteriaceae bacterium]|jgi:hypothetical protein|nr:hypothetical protein [Bifidobacteriaceae bacterium]
MAEITEHAWVKAGSVVALLSAPVDPDWERDLREARLAEDPRDPWAAS